jgi:hypothetical protein
VAKDIQFTFDVQVKKGGILDAQGHVWDQNRGGELSSTCALCGARFTLVQFMTGGITPCPKGAKKECECGAAKTSGAAAGSPLHSSWCPQRA